MAENTRDSTTTTAATNSPPKKLPKGLVLGPDGKPCRTCNTLADFTSQRRSLSSNLFSTAPQSESRSRNPYTATATLSNCPPDIESLGTSSWTLLHSIAASLPASSSSSLSTPNPGSAAASSPILPQAKQTQLRSFIHLFADLYPCWTCAEDFQSYVAREGVRTESREAFGRWLCEAHNDVNRKLGKREFDCSRWEERWGKGWRDGSCD